MPISTRGARATALLVSMLLAGAPGCWLEPEGADLRSGSWEIAPTLTDVPCRDGFAAQYECENVDLLAFVDRRALGGPGNLNDIWGWTDPDSGREYALVGRTDGTAFVDITVPTAPRYLGILPTHTRSSPWRDIKVYDHYAYVVSEAPGHGLQVFDLHELREVGTPLTFSATAHYGAFGSAHNVAINEESGFAYAVGSDTCDQGLHIIDLEDPLEPSFAGCFSGPERDGDQVPRGVAPALAFSATGTFGGCASALLDGSQDGDEVDPDHGGDYTHDTQCVIYRGPHEAYVGRELCFNADGAAGGGHFTIADVTEKQDIARLAAVTYEGAGYIHQGWLTEDHQYFLLGDELDEQRFKHRTRTYIYDVRDLHAPELIGIHEGPSKAIDHNQYIVGRYAYQANYEDGLRILDVAKIASAELTEVGYFRTVTGPVRQQFRGAWSSYPFFDSGVVIVSSIGEGLFILRPTVDDGDGDGDGLAAE
jgi:hypothetical protein